MALWAFGMHQARFTDALTLETGSHFIGSLTGLIFGDGNASGI
jgi:hypothetical protein